MLKVAQFEVVPRQPYWKQISEAVQARGTVRKVNWENITSPKYDLEKPGMNDESHDSTYSLRRPSDEWGNSGQHHISVSIPQAAGDGGVEHNVEKNTSNSDMRRQSATHATAGKDVQSCKGIAHSRQNRVHEAPANCNKNTRCTSRSKPLTRSPTRNVSSEDVHASINTSKYGRKRTPNTRYQDECEEEGFIIKTRPSKIKPTRGVTFQEALNRAKSSGAEMMLQDALKINDIHDIAQVREALDAEIDSLFLPPTSDANTKGGAGALEAISAPPEGFPKEKVLPVQALIKWKYTPLGQVQKVKGRIVLQGNRQPRERYVHSEISTPVAQESSYAMVVALALRLDMDISVLDVTSAFLQADWQDSSGVELALFPPYLARFVVERHPVLQKYMTSNGTLYARLLKGLYGSRQSSTLFFQLIRSHLVEFGLKQNVYDPATFVGLVNNVWYIVLIHVDDLLIASSTVPGRITFIDFLEKKFPGKLKVQDGPILEYLGKQLDFTTPKQCVVSMDHQVQKSIAAATGRSTIPAGPDLFQIKESPKLCEADRLLFHKDVGGLVYLSLRFRFDLALAVSFLATRVLVATEEDQKKLEKVKNYIKHTAGTTLVIKPDSLELQAFVDASHAVHVDGFGHTGVILCLGGAPIWCRSSRQKIVAKSSTEAEILAVSDKLSDVMYFHLYLQQILPPNVPFLQLVLFQDNQSTMDLLETGSASNGRSKHIQNRYFWTTDMLRVGTMRVEYCKTEEMPADIGTKPLAQAPLRAHMQRLGYIIQG